MGNYTSIERTSINVATLEQGTVQVFRQYNFKGNNELLQSGYNSLGSTMNNSISSLIIGPNTRVTFYSMHQKKFREPITEINEQDDGIREMILENETVDKNYYYNDLRKRTNDFTDWTWNDIISSAKVDIIDKKKYKTKDKKIKDPDFTVKVDIGGKEYRFGYGEYHHIWLNTNENIMTVRTHPSDNIRLEFWTGYHPTLGRQILIDRKKQAIVSGKGIIRSLSVLKVRHLKPEYGKPNDVDINKPDISVNYKPHELIRNKKIGKRDVEYKNYNFDKDGKLIEIFESPNNNNYPIMWIIFLLLVTLNPSIATVILIFIPKLINRD